MLDVFTHLSPDQAVLLAVAGVLLIYVELNRPGLILPGALGLLILLLALSSLLSLRLNRIGVVLLAASFCVQMFSLRRHMVWISSATAGFGVFAGCHLLLVADQPAKIHLPEAAVAGVLLGPGTSLLTAIARRARTNKGLDLRV